MNAPLLHRAVPVHDKYPRPVPAYVEIADALHEARLERARLAPEERFEPLAPPDDDDNRGDIMLGRLVIAVMVLLAAALVSIPLF